MAKRCAGFLHIYQFVRGKYVDYFFKMVESEITIGNV